MKKKIIKLTETQLHKIVKRVLSEAYEGGLIQQGDAPCEIWCKVKFGKNVMVNIENTPKMRY